MASNVTTTLQSALPIAAAAAEAVSAGQDESIVQAILHVLLLIVRIIPGFVVWVAAFTTFTLPAWVSQSF